MLQRLTLNKLVLKLNLHNVFKSMRNFKAVIEVTDKNNETECVI